MPYSYSLFKKEIRDLILDWTTPESKIIDIGAGSGGYSDLLRARRPRIDAIEIYEPYVSMFDLSTKYNFLYITDCRSYNYYFKYNFAILGDVLEHLSYQDAIELLGKLNGYGIKMVVAVPYMFEQGEEYGNKNETHLQPDLTKELFLSRYPMMRHYIGDENYGYFVNFDTEPKAAH